jgi:hypothetical protein
MPEEAPISAGGGEETALERGFNRHMGNLIHVFLSVLAALLIVAAGIAVVQTVYREFPALWFSHNPYDALHLLLQQMLLIAIAAELALLLLFHRTSAAIEVVMFVIARRMVATDVTSLDLLIGSVALAVLLVVRFYYLPGKPQ